MDFSCALSWAGRCELQKTSFFFSLQPSLEGDLSDFSIRATFSLVSLLVFCLVIQGWEHLWETVMFVLVHQLHEMEQSGLRERWKRHGCLPQLSSVHVSFPKAPVPGTGFPLLPPENSMFLIHIGGWTKEAGAA